MKNSASFRKSASERSKGMALVLVLGTVAMLAMLVVAFLTIARTEQRSASAFSDTTDARNLAELPINLAIGQIRRATEQLGEQKTWSSQPGMLRVYGIQPDSTTGNFRSTTIALHKLYSDELMVVTDNNATATANGKTTAQIKAELDADVNDLANWQSLPGQYVDLNEPAPMVTAGADRVSTQFPIADPRAIFGRSGGEGAQGFDFAGNTGGVLAAPALPGTVAPTSAEDVAARLPMPVKWLYVLADGRLAAPTGGDAVNGLEFAAAERPSAANPIIGRVAFWVDDDTCKVNVNTATEGAPWDVPKASSNMEHRMSKFLPAQNEFSRYPGHPAQTSLSPVFQMFGSDWRVEHLLADSEAADTARANAIERYMNLNPRVPWGGSRGGTVTPAALVALTDPLGRDKDGRLYANLDEIVFTRDREAQTPVLMHQDIVKGRFFLTTHSRAPELNLFNKSRIMLWPISANAADRTTKDKLLAHQGTTGMGPFYFQRKQNFINDGTYENPGSSQHPDHDLSVTENDPAQVNGAPLRNRELYRNALQHYTGGNTGTGLQVPGFGGNFATKWGASRRNQVLTQMFDFLRWSVNSYSSGDNPQYYFLPQRTGHLLGETSAVPVIASNNTRGFGRFPTVTEVAIVFVATQAPEVGQNATEMQAYLILEPFSPAAGSPTWSPNVRYRITGLDGFRVDEEGMEFPADATLLCNRPTGLVGGEGHKTPFTGLHQQFKRAKGSGVNSGDVGRDLSQNEASGFPFYSGRINVTGKPQFHFSGGSITLEIQTGWWGTSNPARTIQTLRLNFPEATLKVPRKSADYSYNETVDGMTVVKTLSMNHIPSRFSAPGDRYVDVLIRNGDITRSVEISSGQSTSGNPVQHGGDLRLVSLMKEVPAAWFTPHPRYTDRNVERLHFLRNTAHGAQGQYGPGGSDDTIGGAGVSRASSGHTAGTLLRGVPYCRVAPPVTPRGLNGALKADGRPGDWDNGVGRIPDGAMINKADEANLASSSESGYFNFAGFTPEDGRSYSPNRQIASAVAFGSLPSGVNGDHDPVNLKPWQTLLFCPNPASRTSAPLDSAGRAIEPSEDDHEGFKAPRDHLLLDLFWMPIAEPYAISDELSTAGKINMNFEMLPFRHIERSTGIHAAMKPISLLAITPDSVKTMGNHNCNTHVNGHNCKESTVHTSELRYLVNTQKTLQGFKARFAAGDAFRSASEICEIFLVPRRATLPAGRNYHPNAALPPVDYRDMTTWWNGNINSVDAFDATGDNSRESPYNQLYPRLTTKSNSYTIHYRVQMLKKARATNPERWVEGRDAIVSEYRGSAVLERFMDPNDRELTQLTQGNGGTDTLSNHYRVRVIGRKRFAP